MISNEDIWDIKEDVHNSFEDLVVMRVDSLGIYNYIRYCNEDFGNDMYINDPILATDNTEIQHCYLIFILYELLMRKMDIAFELKDTYLENKSHYNISVLEDEIKYIDKKLYRI